ncbi:hypothetical protein E3P86_00388 [Wallemia ichthyophaga]|uniref:Rhodanese domain-containing protein n=1 Tax=Wallemia ichthyophaga TaxID=245174 RepID=A0A4T0JJI4_WALIC|nr:hypothetical protein E3P86_00388 [Wallemia ichthyophaga]
MEEYKEILKDLTINLLSTDLNRAKGRWDRTAIDANDLASYPIPSTYSNTPLIKGYEATKQSTYNTRNLSSTSLSHLHSLNQTKRSVLSEEIERIDKEINNLNKVKFELQSQLLRSREFDLELTDKLSQNPFTSSDNSTFLPDEHDDLPINMPFMSIQADPCSLNDLSIDKPYGHLITASNNPSPRIWNLSTGDEVAQLTGHTDDITSLKFNNNSIVTASRDCSIKLWNKSDFSETLTYFGHTKPIDMIQASQHNIVSGASDQTVRLWDLNSGQCNLTMDLLSYLDRPHSQLQSQSPYIGGLQFYYNALVTGSADSIIRLWDMRTGVPHRNLVGHSDAITCLSFDQYHVISGSSDGTMNIWDIRTGKVLDSLQFESPLTDLQFDNRKVMISGVGDVSMFSDGFRDAPRLQYKDIKPLTKAPTEDRVLIDVREPNEVIQGSIPSSVNLPLSNFEHALDLDDAEFKHNYGFNKPSDGIDDKRNFIFYCRSGKRSATACDLAFRRGIKNINNYQGSYIDWLANEQAKDKAGKEEEEDD